MALYKFIYLLTYSITIDRLTELLSTWWLLHSYLWCGHLTASAFRQSSSPGCAVTQSQHVWSSGFHCCWSVSLELIEWWPAWSCAQHWQLQTYLLKTHLFSDSEY